MSIENVATSEFVVVCVAHSEIISKANDIYVLPKIQSTHWQSWKSSRNVARAGFLLHLKIWLAASGDDDESTEFDQK